VQKAVEARFHARPGQHAEQEDDEEYADELHHANGSWRLSAPSLMSFL
jgi:hypothetical protein